MALLIFRIKILSVGVNVGKIPSTRDANKNGANNIENLGIDFENMQSLLQYVTPRRLCILNILYNSGPTSVNILTYLARKKREVILNDITALSSAGLLERTTRGNIVFPWKGITISVQQSLRYTPTQNLISLVDGYLSIYARKYSWLQIQIITKTLLKNSRISFSSRLKPVQM